MRKRRHAAVLAVTLLIALASPSRAQRPSLRLALILPIGSAALFTPDGEPASDARRRLNSITAVLRDLQTPELDGIPFALAPSPLFCDEAMRLGGRSAAAVRVALRALAARVPVLSAPYAEVRLPDLDSGGAVVREIREGRRRVGPCTGVEPTATLMPPNLTVDSDVVEALPEAGVATALAALRGRTSAVRSGEVTLIPAARIEARDAPNDAYVRLQSFEGAAAILSLGRPDLVTFINAIANDPRVTMTTLAEIASDAPPASVRFSPTDDPPRSYARSLRAAVSSVERLGWYTLPNNKLAAVLRTALGRARSSAEWDGRWSVGRSRASAISERVLRELRLISASEGSVTFTSQSGSVPVTVRNAASYPVRVRIKLDSAKLRFPRGSTRVAIVEPPGDTVVFEALARSTGTFPVLVEISSPNAAIRFDTDQVTVRSTAANVPALALTAGGALFLIAWYARHLRRRRHDTEPEA